MRLCTMRIHLAAVAAIAVSYAAPNAMAGTIANWTFETSQPAGAATANTSFGTIAPEVGVGVASGLHATATTYSTPAGNGSAHSFSSNMWSVGDYYQFQVSTVGQTQIGLLFDQTSSSTGPRDFKVQYSTNGTTFTDTGFTTQAPINGAPNVAWNATTASSVFTRFVDLSTISAVENIPALYLRIADTSTTSAGGGTVATAGTDRVDNVQVLTQVPEPCSLLLVLCGMAGFGLARRR
jgi:hypothetical protein